MSYKNKRFKPSSASVTPPRGDAKSEATASRVSKYASRSNSGDIERQPEDQMALNRQNFIFMICSGALIVIGFLLMLGPSSTVDYFDSDIFSTRRIVVGPLLAFLGFVAMAIAIIVKGKKPIKLGELLHRNKKVESKSKQED